MYSFYYNRILGSLTLICINPENPLPMIATSEIISTISPVLTPNTIKNSNCYNYNYVLTQYV